MNWYLHVWKNYANFNGRASRQEYWMFFLVNILIAFVLGIADGALFGQQVLGLVYILAVLLPSLAVGARRLHDTDRSGWWQLIGLIPLVGGVVLLVFFALQGTRGDNRFGEDPNA